MKTKSLKYLLLPALVVTFARLAQAVPCDTPSSSSCNLPGSGSAAATSASAFNASCTNSTPGDESGSRFYFAAVQGANGPATIGKGGITTTGDGTQAIGGFAIGASGLDGAVVNGGQVSGLLGGAHYTVYAQACPSATARDTGLCSSWAAVVSDLKTNDYPISVFANPQAPTDSTVNSITARVSVPGADAPTISQLNNLEIDPLFPADVAIPVSAISASGNGSYVLSTNLKPNVEYQFKGQVTYPDGIDVPRAGLQTEGPFWTVPVNPGVVTAQSASHCSATITINNSVGSPSNPNYTPYDVFLAGGFHSGQVAFGGSATHTFFISDSNLIPGNTYAISAQAFSGNTPNVGTGWSPSSQVSEGTIQLQSWGNTTPLTVQGTPTTTSAVIAISGLNLGGSDTWQIQLTGGPGVSTPASGTGTPPASVTLSGLNSNTQYSVQIKLHDSAGGCDNVLPNAALSLTTLPVAPTLPASLSNATSNSIQANWSDGSTNGGGTTYHLQYAASTDNGATFGAWTDFGTNPPKAGGSPQSVPITGLTIFTTYKAQVKTVSVTGNSANDSGYFQIPGVLKTNDTNLVVTQATPQVFVSSALFSVASVTGGVPTFTYSWSVSPSAGTSFTSPTGSSTYMLFSSLQSYAVTVTVTDNGGAGPGTGSDLKTINPGQTPSTMDPIQAPNGASVVVGASIPFNVVVRNQFGVAIPNQAVTWSLNNGAASLSPTVSSFTAVTGVNSTLSPVTLTASINGIQQTISVTVLASGPQFTVNPTIALNADGKTAHVHAVGINNSPGAPAMKYNWTLESGPSAISVSPNDAAAATDATVTFSAAGTYVLRCKISGVGDDTFTYGSNFALTPSTTVAQVLASVTVCPAGVSGCPSSITVKTLQNQQFTASGVDQFGAGMGLSSVQWSNNVSASGASASFSSPSLGNNIRVAATVSGKTGFVNVNVISFDVSGAFAFPVPYKANTGTGFIHFKGLGSQSTLHIYSTSGRRVLDLALSSDTYDWDIKNSSGESVASGVYFYLIESPEGKKNGKLIIIK